VYSDLYNAWKSEISTREPQSLPTDFYKKTETYLAGLKHETEAIDAHSVKGRLTFKEKEVGDRLLRELKEIRIRKLIELAQNDEMINETNLTEEEKGFVEDFNKSLENLNHAKAELTPVQPAPVEEKVELSFVRFLQDIPEIVGTDLRIYGPYRKEDVGSLPSHNAQALVKQGAAKEIEVRGIVECKKS